MKNIFLPYLSIFIELFRYSLELFEHYKGKQKLYLIKSDVNFNSSPDNNISGENILLQDHITISGQLVYSHKNIGYAVIEDRFLGEELFVGRERIFAEG